MLFFQRGGAVTVDINEYTNGSFVKAKMKELQKGISMAHIQTVLGKIKPEDLGITMMHEHLLWNQECYQSEIEPDTEEYRFAYSSISPENMTKIRLYNLHKHRQTAKQTDPEEATEEVMYFRRAGGTALVDCTCLGLDRDPDAEVMAAQKTGLHIVMATGIYSHSSCPEAETMTFAEKRDMFIREITDGVGENRVKAGVIGEIGISDYVECEQDTLAAAAAAQAETGAAILIHQPGIWKIGHELLDLITEHGGDVCKTVLCHCDPICDDIHYLERLLQRGATLSFDQFGLEAYLGRSMGKIWLPRDIERVRAIARLCELGYSKQIVLSQDLSFQICYRKYGGGGYAHILENILPIMRDEGIYEKCMDRMLIENPRRLLSIAD